MSIAVQKIDLSNGMRKFWTLNATYSSPVLAIRRSRGHPKNDGCSKSESVTAVTATEAGSAAGYSGGRYGIMKPSPVAAEAGRSYPLKGPARAI